jgi:ABC-type bacteriocin/lantibiotic exporter with double-glycine peptidase domain
MLAFFRPHAATMARGAVLGLIAAGLEMAIPLFSRYIIDDVVGKRNYGLLELLVLAMVGTLLLTSAVSVLQRFILSRATMTIDRESLTVLARNMLSLPTHYFAARRAGDIDQRLGSLRQARQFYVENGVGALTALAQLIVALVMMASSAQR